MWRGRLGVLALRVRKMSDRVRTFFIARGTHSRHVIFRIFSAAVPEIAFLRNLHE
jgi:hypothetical protein